MKELNADQKRAIAALKRVGKKWPKGIWLMCNGNSMAVVMTGPNGEHIMGSDGCVDQEYTVDHIEGIDHDGGDY